MDNTNIKLCNNPSKLSSFLKMEIVTILIIAITGIIYNGGMILNPYFQGRLIDLVNGLTKSSDYLKVVYLVLIYVGCIFIVQVSRALKRFFVRKFGYNTTSSMRLIIFNNILNTPLNELENQNIGKLIACNISDVNKTVEGLRKALTEIFDTILLFIFYICYLFLFDIKATLLSLIPVIFSIFLAFLIRKLVYKYSLLSRKANSKITSSTYDLVDNTLIYKIYGQQQSNLKKYNSYLSEYEKYNRKVLLLNDISKPLVNIISLIGLVPIIYYCLPLVINQNELTFKIFGDTTIWTIGVFTTYISTFVLLSSKASHTSKLFTSINEGKASYRQIKDLIKPYKKYPTSNQVLTNPSIKFNNYSIKINDKTYINNLNLELKKGDKLFVSGIINTGKSLFLKSLIQVIPYQGELYINNTPLKDYPNPIISNNIAYLGHKSELFTSSIKENIEFDKNEDVLTYLKDVDFMTDLESMEEKENTIIGNRGVKLSGGQQQRISIARTLFENKNIVLLDDPFSSLDYKTEDKIINNIYSRCKDSILIITSHRLSFFKDQDKILFLNPDGSYIYGSHSYLMENSSMYKQLYLIQQKGGNYAK